MMKIIKIILLMSAMIFPVFGQEADTVAVGTFADTLSAASADTSTSISADSAQTKDPDDLADLIDEEDDTQDFADAEADGIIAAEPQQKLDLVKRDHDHKRQVKLAIVMMTFIIFALTSAQSWNPR